MTATLLADGKQLVADGQPISVESGTAISYSP